jgi:hypothetical protein
VSQAGIHDYSGVIHLHSTHSDGTGTAAEIARAGRENALDFVLLTDHDTLAARQLGEEGWYGGTLLLAGVEVSPVRENHYLAFGIENAIDHQGLDPAGICQAVADRGGFGFLAHPFSRGNPRIRRTGEGMPWRDLDCGNYTGIELWSFVTDTGESVGGVRDFLTFLANPLALVDHPPERNLAEWDRLCRDRRVVAIGGLDAHQLGIRIGGRVPLRLMAYRRSFRHLRTHVLDERTMTGDLDTDRETIFGALREGRCYLAMDSLAPARGFGFWAEGDGEVAVMGEERSGGEWAIRAVVPRPAELRLLKDGEIVSEESGLSEISRVVEGPGVYRVEARLPYRGRPRTWILSNPIYLRG